MTLLLFSDAIIFDLMLLLFTDAIIIVSGYYISYDAFIPY